MCLIEHAHEDGIDVPEELFIYYFPIIDSAERSTWKSTGAFNNMSAILNYKFVARVFGYGSDRVVVTINGCHVIEFRRCTRYDTGDVVQQIR